MSYILEALKKSQNERELGQVPTLVAAPATEANRAPRGKPWGLVAGGVGAVALAVALYAALTRVEVQPATVQPEPPVTAAPSGAPAAAAQTLSGAEPQQGPESQIATVPVVPIRTPDYPPQTPDSQALGDGSTGARGLAAPGPSASAQQTLGETAIRGDVPPMARDGRPPRRTTDRDTLASVEEDTASIEGVDGGADVMDEPISNDWMEMDQEIGPAEPVEAPPPVPDRQPHAPTGPSPPALPAPEVAPIPEDLRQDVQAFKEQLRRERSGGAPRPATAKAAPEDPTKLRLPLEIESRLPAFFLRRTSSDTEVSKRFVVINALETPGRNDPGKPQGRGHPARRCRLELRGAPLLSAPLTGLVRGGLNRCGPASRRRGRGSFA